jgi:hypothetical protein
VLPEGGALRQEIHHAAQALQGSHQGGRDATSSQCALWGKRNDQPQGGEATNRAE